MPPSYGSQEYWNKRFTDETKPFEWLGEPHVLNPFLRDALSNNTTESQLRLLHIGCGTSMLSHHLRTLVKTPGQIHNLDYSKIAIDLGRSREKELYDTDHFEDYNTADGAAKTSMNWDVVDMLDHKSLLSVCQTREYSIIVDKSTSDSIACCDAVHIPLPYPIDVPSGEAIDMSIREAPEPIHPLHVLAVHLALVTKPGARWIAFSYSDDRFPFADGLYSSRPHFSGFPDTGTLWKLLDKHEIESREQTATDSGQAGAITHKPKVSHWVYILQRTETPLALRGAHL